MNPYLAAFAKPAVFCILLGVVQFAQDYQATGKLVPSLVDGIGAAAKTGVAWATYNGVVLSGRAAKAQLAAPKAPPGA